MAAAAKYWFGGRPLPGIEQPQDIGGLAYWFRGLPMPVLVGTALPPGATSPVQAIELPAALFSRRFPIELRTWSQGSPPVVVVVDADTGNISILW